MPAAEPRSPFRWRRRAAWRHLRLLLTGLPLALALLACALWWHGGGGGDPASRRPPHMADRTTPNGPSHPSCAFCAEVHLRGALLPQGGVKDLEEQQAQSRSRIWNCNPCNYQLLVKKLL